MTPPVGVPPQELETGADKYSHTNIRNSREVPAAQMSADRWTETPTVYVQTGEYYSALAVRNGPVPRG